MHAQRRRILTSLAAMARLSGVILGLAISPAILFAQAPKGTPKKTADPAARKVAAQAPPVAQPDPEAERKMEELLQRWEKKSATIKTLSVKYKRVDSIVVFDSVIEYEGDARFTSSNKAYLDFFEVAKGKAKSFDQRIVCDGENVYQFEGKTKQIFIFPLPENRQQKALQQGPLPFLFNMRGAEAKQRYKMILKRDDPNSYQILIIPLLKIDREEYSQAVIRLDKQRLIPTGIHLWAPNGKDTKTFTFAAEGLVENRVIPDSWFDGTGMVGQLRKNGWKVVPAPGNVENAPAVGVRPAAGGRPAMKGQAGAVRQK